MSIVGPMPHAFNGGFIGIRCIVCGRGPEAHRLDELMRPDFTKDLAREREELFTKLATQPKENTPMSVRAKFVVSARRDTLHWSKKNETLCTVEMSPVTSGSEENQKFYEATPSGKIELGVLNGEAAKQFELGKTYYVDFTPAE